MLRVGGIMSKNIMSVIMLNWNRLNYSRLTLDKIIKSSSMSIELIIVDNNSTPESGIRDYFVDKKNDLENRFEKVVYVFNDRNFGVGGGRNTGLMHATGQYLCSIDDDVLVPDKWDVLLAEACDKVVGLGITGINVEPFKFPVKVISGVRMRPKAGNLGGACLCLPRRVFKRLGYYMAENIYGQEDVEMRCRLDLAGLLSAYIEPKGIHLDKDELKVYRGVKNNAHIKGSVQISALAQFRRKLIIQHQKTGSLYVPFNPDNFNPVDDKIFTNELIKKG